MVQARSIEIYRPAGRRRRGAAAAQRAVALAPGFGPRVFGRIPLGGEGVTPYETNPHPFSVIDATGAGGLVEGAINVRPGGEDSLLAFP